MLDLSKILVEEEPIPPFLVDGIFYAGQTAIIGGEEGCGKSFLMYRIAFSVALGIPFGEREVKQGKVLYFDEENSKHDLGGYLRALWKGLDCPDIPTLEQNLLVSHFDLSLMDKKRWDYMGKLAEKFQPHLIVLDTATPVCQIENENDNSQASNAIRHLRAVRGLAGDQCCTVILKHQKRPHEKDDTRTIRGAKAWLGEADMVLYLNAHAGRPRADGFRPTSLERHKKRFYGLATSIDLDAHKTKNGGIQLDVSPPDKS